MAHDIDSVTLAAVSLALDAAALRHRAIASNIANHGTPGYLPVTVDFATQMAQVQRGADGTLDPAGLAHARPALRPLLDANGAPAKVQLDASMAEMAQNTMHYQALTRALNRHLAITMSAASDGKR